MRQINLKSDNGNIKKRKNISLSLILGLLLLVVAGAISGGLFLYEMQLEKRVTLVADEISKKEQDIDSQKFKEVYDLQGRIIDIDKYLSEANNQTEFLGVVSSRTFGNTIFKSIDLSQSSPASSVVEAIILVSNFDDLASQLNAYKQSDQIEDLKLNSSSLEDNGLLASITFNVKSL